jgi:hypothetical protein
MKWLIERGGDVMETITNDLELIYNILINQGYDPNGEKVLSVWEYVNTERKKVEQKIYYPEDLVDIYNLSYVLNPVLLIHEDHITSAGAYFICGYETGYPPKW